MLLAMTDPDDALYARMRWNVPLSAGHADLLLDRLALQPGQRLADLGCGWGALLRTAVARAGTGATGTGIDQDGAALDRGRAEAARDGLAAGSVEFVEADAAGWDGTADRVLCTGASHAFGGTARALRALANVVPSGGRALFGDGFWERAPGPEAVELFGAEVQPLPGLLQACRAAGWRVIHFSVADQREWDDFESTFLAGRQEWLLASAGHPRAAEIRDWIDFRERQYFSVYRGVLGYAYLVIAR
jgi:ubiquinone/menaquinone biosynthesis C-methylase UbiE